MTNPDILIVGAGHNGLVTAAYLARAGKAVLVLEKQAFAGGQLAGRELFGPGNGATGLHASGQLRPDIVRDLDLARHGIATSVSAESPYVSALPDGGELRLVSRANDAATLESIRALSAKDAARWPEFIAFMNTAAGFLDAAYRTPMPRLPKLDWRHEGWPLASLAWKLRGLGKTDMFRVIRSLSMSAIEFTEEWFESEPLKAAIAALGIHGQTLGSMSAGTGYILVHHWLNRAGLAHRGTTGDLQQVTDGLVAALRASGGQLRTSAGVAQVLVEGQRAIGVRLESGEEIRAQTVVSAADPRHTLLTLVGAAELPPEFVWQAQSIKMRGSVAKVHALTDGSHGLPGGTVVIAPSLKYLERAYDASKYGEISGQPYLEVTTSGPIVSIHFQFAPYKLRIGDWGTRRAELERIAVDTLSARYPAFARSMQRVATLSPLAIEQGWSLTEGDLNHGQLILDQLFYMRPLPGWSNHRTPIDGLFLCGGGGHGGGGISGAAGRNAARQILKAHIR